MYETSLRIVDKLFDLPAKAQHLNNLGAVYLEKCDYFSALKNFKKALEIDKKLGDPIGRSKRLNNIGIIYQRQGTYLLALQNYKISLKINKFLSHSPALPHPKKILPILSFGFPLFYSFKPSSIRQVIINDC